MIQRIQTLCLLLAVVLLVVFSFVPFGFCQAVDVATGVAEVESLMATGFIGVILPLAAAVILGVVAICSFKKLALQKSLTIFAALFTLVTIGVVIYVLVSGFMDTNPEVTIVKLSWGGGGLLLVAALIAFLAAIRGISADQRLLRSYDRLR